MYHRFLPALLALFLVRIALCSSSALGEGPPPGSGDKHAWARFGVGSWKLVRVHSQKFDAHGQSEGLRTSEVKTTLDQCDEHGYTLRLEVTDDVASKRLPSDPQSVTYGYLGEADGQVAVVKELGDDAIEIDGRAYPTSLSEIILNGGSSKSVSVMYYSPSVPPYVLRRTTETTDLETGQRIYHSAVNVTAVDMPERVLTEIMSAAHVETIETFMDGSTKSTREVLCSGVPGGVVRQVSKQTRADGGIARRSTLELVNFEAVERQARIQATGPLRRRLFDRRRN